MKRTTYTAVGPPRCDARANAIGDSKAGANGYVLTARGGGARRLRSILLANPTTKPWFGLGLTLSDRLLHAHNEREGWGQVVDSTRGVS